MFLLVCTSFQCPEKDIATYSGLVQSHIAIGKLQDAVNYAKEAIKEMPGSASAYCIFGKVLMQAPNGTTEATKAFSKALKLRYGSCCFLVIAKLIHFHMI